MLCQYCNTDNPNDAEYCRTCGKVMRVRTVMEQFSNLDFVPVTLLNLKSSKGVSFFFLATFFIIGSLMTLLGIAATFFENEPFNLVIALPFFIGCLLIYFIALRCKVLEKAYPNFFLREKLSRKADYIQKDFSINEGYIFMVKDNKFGLYNSKQYKVQLPAIYDLLSWKIEGQILNAQQKERQYVIDIYGNELK